MFVQCLKSNGTSTLFGFRSKGQQTYWLCFLFTLLVGWCLFCEKKKLQVGFPFVLLRFW